MSPRFSTLCLIAANLLTPLALLTFASGFFPYKPFLPGRATFENYGDHGSDHVRGAPFEKVIFMVVDALRRLAYHRLGFDHGC